MIFFAVFSSGMDRLYGNPMELSTKASIVDPVDFISGYNADDKRQKLFIGRNNTEIWAHRGSNVVFDCLVGRPNLQDHGPVSTYIGTWSISSKVARYGVFPPNFGHFWGKIAIFLDYFYHIFKPVSYTHLTLPTIYSV